MITLLIRLNQHHLAVWLLIVYFFYVEMKFKKMFFTANISNRLVTRSPTHIWLSLQKKLRCILHAIKNIGKRRNFAHFNMLKMNVNPCPWILFFSWIIYINLITSDYVLDHRCKCITFWFVAAWPVCHI